MELKCAGYGVNRTEFAERVVFFCVVCYSGKIIPRKLAKELYKKAVDSAKEKMDLANRSLRSQESNNRGCGGGDVSRVTEPPLKDFVFIFYIYLWCLN